MQAMDMELIRFFHGHIGPWVVLGVKISEACLTRLGLKRNDPVKATVACDLKPPTSCVIDGLQLGSGATLGKRRIEIVQSDTVLITMTDNRSGKTVQVQLKPHTIEWMLSKYKELGDDGIGALMRDTPNDDLFTLEEVA